MPRTRISKNGIEIAKPGKDVDTATLQDMLFAPQFVATRLALTGIATVVNYSGQMDDYYRRAIVTFPSPFVRPPIAMVAGIRADGTAQFAPFTKSIVSGQNGWVRGLPHVELRSYVDKLEIYVRFRDGASTPAPVTVPSNWRYFVFANTLDL